MITPAVVGLASPVVNAHSTRSTPDSASARAWALATWLLAICGSLVARTAKAAMSAVRMAMTISAIGSAIPRSFLIIIRSSLSRALP